MVKSPQGHGPGNNRRVVGPEGAGWGHLPVRPPAIFME